MNGTTDKDLLLTLSFLLDENGHETEIGKQAIEALKKHKGLLGSVQRELDARQADFDALIATFADAHQRMCKTAANVDLGYRPNEMSLGDLGRVLRYCEIPLSRDTSHKSLNFAIAFWQEIALASKWSGVDRKSWENPQEATF